MTNRLLAWALDRRQLKLARWLSFDAATRAWLDMQLAVQRGDVAVARRIFEKMPSTALGDVYGWNLMVNALIAQGRYHEAVSAKRRSKTRLLAVRREQPMLYGLALLNVSEALYNLGRWRRARQLMLSLGSNGLLEDPLNRAAGEEQLAWIAAHTGRPDEALQRLAKVDISALPFDYRAELHFTFAAAHLAHRDLPSARASLDSARRAVVRPASARNLLLLEARCAHAEGKLREAAELCERAANHPYRGQGGDGLLLWGEVCHQLGDSAGARSAWQLALERDPESESAARARERLK